MGTSREAGKQGQLRDTGYRFSRRSPIHSRWRGEKYKENKDLDLGCRMPQKEEK